MKNNKSLFLISFLLLSLVSAHCLEVPITMVPQISVSVTGNVKNPGVYQMTSLNRISDAIKLASEDISPLPTLPTGPLPVSEIPKTELEQTQQQKLEQEIQMPVLYDQRSVVLHRNGTKQILDMMKFYRLGDISQNPFLKDGDVIVVNAVLGSVSVVGSINKPGDYEFRAGDTIKDIIDIALGVNEDADCENIQLHRYKSNKQDFEIRTLNLTGYPERCGSDAEVRLESGDRVFVPFNSQYRFAYKIIVDGKVKMPGYYSVGRGTTLYDLMVMCGGPTPEADLHNSFVYNSYYNTKTDIEVEKLAQFSTNPITPMDYNFTRIKYRQQKGRYSIDVKKVWESKGKEVNLTLKDGDYLVVPEKMEMVWVSGQVKNPGMVDWKADMNWKHYISAAGGYSNMRKCGGVRILKTGSNNWVKPTNNIVIEPGDILFVSEKSELILWEEIKTLLTMTSQVVTIVIGVRTIWVK